MLCLKPRLLPALACYLSVHLHALSATGRAGQNGDDDGGNSRDDDGGDYQRAAHQHGRVEARVDGTEPPVTLLATRHAHRFIVMPRRSGGALSDTAIRASILTSRPSANITPPKQLFCTSMITSSVQ